MTSLVAEFLVNPVIRQARRFSLTVPSNQAQVQQQHHHHQPVQRGLRSQEIHNDAASETDRESLNLEDEIEETHATTVSSRTSVVQLGPHGDVACPQAENDAQSDRAPITDPDNIPRNHDLNITPPSSRAEPPTRDLVAGIQQMEGDSNLPSRVGEDDSDVLRDVEPPPPEEEAQKPKEIPEDDGMSLLRRRILDIQSQDIPPAEKARLMHHLFQEGYAKSKPVATRVQPSAPTSPSATLSDNPAAWQRLAHGPLESFRHWQSALLEGASTEEFNLTEDDIRPTFAPPIPSSDSPEDAQAHREGDDSGDRPFGCKHYRRNVKLQCSTCNRWHTCRFCHDQVEDHVLIRKETKNMLCMFCGTAQRAGEVCVSCGVSAARYYCDICKLWNDDPDKNVYHCNDCGICRIGRGLGKDFFHCKVSSPSTHHSELSRLTNTKIEMLRMYRHFERNGS